MLPLGFILLPFLCHFIDENYQILSKLKILKYSFCFGFGFFISFFVWLKNPFLMTQETESLFFIAIILIIFLAIIFSIIFTTLICYLKFIPMVYLLPIILILTEFIISNLFYGFPWLSFSLIIIGTEHFSPILKNFGTIMTSYIVVQVFCLPYLFFKKRKNLKNESIFIFSIFLIPVIFIIIVNQIFSKKENSTINELDLEIFQLNQNIKLDRDVLDIRLENIINFISQSEADVLVFGENNYPYLITDFNFKQIQKILNHNQVVIIGGTRVNNNNYYNTLVNITSKSVDYFDKKILVPFGEFLPLRDFLFFFESISGSVDFSKGNKERLIKLKNNLNYLPVICYEIIFYWKLFNKFNQKTDFIVNITNDIWFGNYIGPYQHLYIAKLRAAEFNKPIIRVSNNGISGIINERGKIVASTELNKINTIKYRINLKQNKNHYLFHYLLKIYLVFMYFFLTVFYFKKNNEN